MMMKRLEFEWAPYRRLNIATNSNRPRKISKYLIIPVWITSDNNSWGVIMFAFQIQYASEVVLLETFNWHCEQQSIWWNIMERSHSSEGNLIKQNLIRTHKGNFNWQLLIIYFIKENQLSQHEITWDAEVPASLCDLERRDGSRPR